MQRRAILDSSVSPEWLNRPAKTCSHDNAIEQIMPIPKSHQARETRATKSIYKKPVPITDPTPGSRWPMDSYEPPPFPPPWPSDEELLLLEAESASLHPEAPLGPRAQQWTNDLCEWFKKLQAYFEFDPSDLASNVRRSAPRWRKRLEYLRHSNKARYDEVMELIEVGHAVPFEQGSVPPKFFRHKNPVSLAKDKVRAWEAIKKDISHGAIIPVNIAEDGMPKCVCPVRTADKSNGKARFVHNSRKVNKFIPKEAVQCELESLLRIRNMFIPNGYVIGSDFASGYHCIYVREQDRTYLAFALHVSELTESALEWLRENHPEAYVHEKRCYIFKYVALPFGLSSSCRVFSLVITALTGFWRTLPTEGKPTRASSYIDDITSVIETFRGALRMAIRIVYESASLGLSLQIQKCSFFPRHAIKTLGTIVDLTSFTFQVSRSRVGKIRTSILKLEKAIAINANSVPARLVASFVGLIWSIATCCHRAASVMLRSVIAVLAAKMKSMLAWLTAPISIILSRFWSGSIKWTCQAQAQLNFWKRVNYGALRAPISADVLGKAIESIFHYPDMLNHSSVSILYQDASAVAAGGGVLNFAHGRLCEDPGLFLAQFTSEEARASSTYRELVGILWCLQSTAHVTKHRIVFACDNWQSVHAIIRGSRNPTIQGLAERIFQWCLDNNRVCWPVWLPRTDPVIMEADRRSRMTIPHDARTPQPVVNAANNMAMRTWHLQLSFDQAASHKSAICVSGNRLPFNAFCMQPGASGVDTFRCWQSWDENVNFIHPPAPMAGRLATFLPATHARVIVVIPTPDCQAWWHYAILPNSDGFCEQIEIEGFLVTAFDFSAGNTKMQAAHTGLATLMHAITIQLYDLSASNIERMSNTTMHSRRHRSEADGRVHENESACGTHWPKPPCQPSRP